MGGHHLPAIRMQMMHQMIIRHVMIIWTMMIPTPAITYQ
jgi:hypothetical protein